MLLSISQAMPRSIAPSIYTIRDVTNGELLTFDSLSHLSIARRGAERFS